MMILIDASQNIWERRWFVLRRYCSCQWIRQYADGCSRPYLHVYAHSNELEETAIISLTGVSVENDPQKELLLGVSRDITCLR
jgi:kinesin family member 1